MQEAFVAALLAIARKSDSGGYEAAASSVGCEKGWVDVDVDAVGSGNEEEEFDEEEYGEGDDDGGDDHDGGDDDDDDGDDLDEYILWVELKKQVKILREGMEDES